MQIVQADDVSLERGLEHRGGTFHFRRMLEGEAGQLDNFQLSFGQMGGEFYSPRHKHNFEQIRFQFEGVLDFGRDGKLTPGMVGYFPEGAPYGPQTQGPDDTPKSAVLQFGGASGSGYLSRNEVKAGMEELKQFGEFTGGVFRRHEDVEGKRNMDGYQAIWEHKNGRPMIYPKPRYPHPIFMNPEEFQWVAVPGREGVFEKVLGVFTERGTKVRLVKIEAGSECRLSGRGVFIALEGVGDAAGQTLRYQTTIYLDHGEEIDVHAERNVHLLHYGLPDLRGLKRISASGQLSAAAE
ncbi:MAG: hypothetical protein ACK4MV_09680 [Beijerinckiaceae bacterium]